MRTPTRRAGLAMDEGTKTRRIAALALGLSLLAALLLLVSGPGNRIGWWEYRMAFGIMGWAAWGGVAGAAGSLLIAGWAMFRRNRRAALIAAVGAVIGALVFAFPLLMRSSAGQVPPIHDISTDTDDPPEFSAVLPLRAGRNTSVYGGPALAAQQKKAYPDIAPLMLALPPAAAYERCLALARAMNWEIVDANPALLRIEATDTTRFFGFKDDVVIRIKPAGAGSRIDIRSLSRVGRSDLGVNARRIRAYLARLAPAP